MVAEICLATPLSNAKSERAFSFLWRNLSRERLSMKNNGMENILCLHGNKDFSNQRYHHAITLFLEEYPDGKLQQRSCHLDGHTYPKNRKSKTTKPHNQYLLLWIMECLMMKILKL